MSRRLDASMDLLKVIRETALDPGYRSSGGRGSRWARIGTLVALLALGLMMAMSMTDSGRATPHSADERADLVARIAVARDLQNALRANLVTLEATTQRLAESLVSDPRVRADLETLEPIVGVRPVQGPGVTITVDDAERATNASQLVTDRDLRQLVNGLWKAGAEAIEINGHRLSARTAIRSAGSAITVDYSSLVHPYVVVAIGDPRKLPAAFAETSGGSWWNSLQANYGLRFDLRPTDTLTLSADPGLTVTRASSNREEER